MEEKPIRIIDKRSKEKFQMDDSYLNGYARLCGIYATGVYVSLCRHANKDQYCFPSFKLMADELAISEKSVQRAIAELVKWNIIEVLREKKDDGTWKNNAYTLLDKSVWRQKSNQKSNSPVDIQRSVSPEPEVCQSVDQRSVGPQKETHSEGNTYKETHSATPSVAGSEINRFIELFKQINPSYKTLYRNTTQRKALERMIAEHGAEKVERLIQALPSIITQRYAPRITTPLKLEERLGDLFAFLKQKGESLPTVAKIR